MAKINFTKKTLEDLPSPAKGRSSYSDEKERGLIIRVTAKGHKSFQLYQKHNGRPVRITLGTFPEMSVENARKAAQVQKAELAKGINPNVEKNKFRQEATLKELFQEYMERYSKREKKSWIYDQREIPRFLSQWFNRKISDISKQEVQKLHEKIRDESGPYQANRLLERLKAMYNKAIEWGWDGTNPAHTVKKFREKSRDRFLQKDELPRFFKALEQEENQTAADVFRICLFTGARKTNVLQMQWKDISFDMATWRIPETKNGDPLPIPLGEEALQVLISRKLNAKSSPWVFPSPVDETSHLNDPKKAWARVLERADIENLRIHDLRRTFGSWQAISGANMLTIGKSLGHKSSKSTEVYAHLYDDPIRKSINKVGSLMAEMAKGDNDE